MPLSKNGLTLDQNATAKLIEWIEVNHDPMHSGCVACGAESTIEIRVTNDERHFTPSYVTEHAADCWWLPASDWLSEFHGIITPEQHAAIKCDEGSLCDYCKV